MLDFTKSFSYRQFYHTDNFLYDIAINNRFELDGELIDLFPYGKTGYEQYYIDLEGFWRQLYQPNWEPINYEIKNGVTDWIKPDTIYRLITCKNQNNELIPIEEIKRDYLNTDYYKNFYHKDGFQYLYGPLTITENSISRPCYGTLNSIIEINYRILQKIYLNKFFQDNKNITLTDSLKILKDESVLYYYDPNTYVAKDQNDNINLYYHPLKISGDFFYVEPYIKWLDSSKKETVITNNIDFFEVPQQWYYKVTIQDKNDIVEDFRLLGTYYPISPEQVFITDEQILIIKKRTCFLQVLQ